VGDGQNHIITLSFAASTVVDSGSPVDTESLAMGSVPNEGCMQPAYSLALAGLWIPATQVLRK